ASNPACIVLIPESREIEAREALLENARKETAHGVDPSHPMTTWGNEDLVKTLTEAPEWSPYEVAVAEKLLKDRGANFEKVQFRPAKPAPAAPAVLEEGSPLPGIQSANPWVVGFGFLAATLGVLGYVLVLTPFSILAVLVAWNCIFSTELQPDGSRRFVHNPRTRTIGVVLFCYTLAIVCVFFGVVLTDALAED
ncbi:MAG: hypothetical protein ACAH88_02065, partial [Roseimicrobium sp.]